MAEAQRRAQERAARGAARIAVDPALTGGAIEGEGEAGRARHVDPGGENATEPLLALGRLQPLDQDLDAVPRPQIAREVHFPVVDVSNGPGERDTLADGEKRVGNRRVECVVQIRLNDGGGAEPLGRPGDLFDRLRPPGIAAEAGHDQMALRIEPHAEAIGDGRALQAAQLEDQAPLHAPGIEAVRGPHEADVLAAGNPAPRQHIGQDLAATERVGPLVVRARHHERQRDRQFSRRPCLMRSPPQQTRGECTGRDVMTRSPPPPHQSICLRMKVGISISFSSGFSGACAGPRLGATSAGFANPGGGTGVGRAARSRNGSTPAAGRCTPASASAIAPVLSNPVAMTVIRTSPCIAGSFTAPKIISASSPAASWIASLICVTSQSVRSSPPVMLISTPVAPAIEMLSSSGLEIACCAASIARFSPRPWPVPINAVPPFCITVRTSAKSTLTRPVTQIRAEIP